MNVNTIKIKWAENELSQNTHVVEFENSCIIIDAGCSLGEIKKITNKLIVNSTHFFHRNRLIIQPFLLYR